MTRIVVLPSGIEFEAAAGETVMGAAQSCGLYWPTTCGGQGICTTCLSEVVEGAAQLMGMSRSERKTLVAERGEAVLQKALRLMCQTAVLGTGAVTVRKPGVRSASEA